MKSRNQPTNSARNWGARTPASSRTTPDSTRAQTTRTMPSRASNRDAKSNAAMKTPSTVLLLRSTVSIIYTVAGRGSDTRLIGVYTSRFTMPRASLWSVSVQNLIGGST